MISNKKKKSLLKHTQNCWIKTIMIMYFVFVNPNFKTFYCAFSDFCMTKLKMIMFKQHCNFFWAFLAEITLFPIDLFIVLYKNCRTLDLMILKLKN